VAPRACVRVYARGLVPPNLYVHIYGPSRRCTTTPWGRELALLPSSSTLPLIFSLYPYRYPPLPTNILPPHRYHSLPTRIPPTGIIPSLLIASLPTDIILILPMCRVPLYMYSSLYIYQHIYTYHTDPGA